MAVRFRLASLFVLITSFVVAAPRAVAQDCDSNGIADADELVLRDCNRNGVIDACDLSAQTSPDCNGNGLPDECDVFAPCAMEPSGFAGGDGTLGNPYLVCTPAQLDRVRNHLDAHFRQIADISLRKVKVYNQLLFRPIGSPTSPFLGTYDGDGYTISDLFLADGPNEPLGLFGFCTGNANLKNIVIRDGFVGRGPLGSSSKAGILVGEFGGSGDIENCHAEGVILGVVYAGGLVGCFSGSGTIKRCSFSGVSRARFFAGGLSAVVSGGGHIQDCFATGVVVAYDQNPHDSGGLICSLENGSVSSCYAATNPGTRGGLIFELGESTGPVFDSYWDTEVGAASTSAAGTGLTTAQMQMQASFDPTWDFSTTWFIDEGASYPQIRRLAVKGTEFDCNANDIPDSCELAMGNSLDCNGNGIIDACDLAAPCVTEASGFAGGSGTILDPFQICSVAQLDETQNVQEPNQHFAQTAHLDLENHQLDALPYLRGSFDGGGYEIRNLTISSPRFFGHAGLFPVIESSLILDVNIPNGNYARRTPGTLAGSAAGLLAGEISGGTVEGCAVAGLVTGDFTFAGLICGEGASAFRQCSSSGTVFGRDFAGGLVGRGIGSSFYDCYSTTSVFGTVGDGGPVGAAGGLTGQLNNGAIERSYTAGFIQGQASNAGGLFKYGPCGFQVLDSFWDVEASGQSETCPNGAPADVQGLTTAEMQMQSTYEPEWDFENIWTIDEGNDYPRLRPYRRFVLGTETDDNGNGLIDSCDVGGDLDGDGAVTVADIPLFVNVLLTNGNGTLTDLNRDYRTNADDLPLFLAVLVGTP